MMHLKPTLALLFLAIIFGLGCTEKRASPKASSNTTALRYAKGFSLQKRKDGTTILKVTSPWPNAKDSLVYALVPKEHLADYTGTENDFTAIIGIPVHRVVATSTTHIPALESLGVLPALVGFPGTDYISSKNARERIENGLIKDLGQNEQLNTEYTLKLAPDVVFGFGMGPDNNAYDMLENMRIPTVFNGEWTEQDPLGKAEWIKFFAPFFGKEAVADSIFRDIERGYLAAKELAKTAKNKPTVLSGALYKDVWYLPAGDSWAAKFLEDAHADYLFSETEGNGSLSLGWETVLEKAGKADYWIGAAQFKTYSGLARESPHYMQFKAFQDKKVTTFSAVTGPTGGVRYYELGPQRPDLVLKDIVHYIHPELDWDYTPFFLRPLKP